jgi:hypothetical protein
VTPPGWREAAGAYGEDGVYRSVADITDAESLAKVRSYKQGLKAAAKAAASEPAASEPAASEPAASEPAQPKG